MAREHKASGSKAPILAFPWRGVILPIVVVRKASLWRLNAR
jgi:hypothetical protein